MPENTTKNPSNELLTGAEVEAEFNIKAKTLRQWRYEKTGPEYIKLGDGKRGHVLYRRIAIESWLAEHTVTPTGS